ncbi:MAG TPA: TetR/AcrR family transcriptional regulator [Cryptosporangiaceae bacterium]|nr:TetR/AcrR family transcriptional regulator [Cryptosporangiaceae bacterium]
MARRAESRGSLARTHEAQPGLPRGRNSLPPELVGTAQRHRLLRAVIAAAAELGYPEITIAEIVGRARVSRKAFYDHFPDKESCFVAAMAAGVELVFLRVGQAVDALPRETDAVQRLRVSLRAYLQFFADEPEFARVFVIDSPAAGPRAAERFVAARERFLAIIRSWHARLRRERPEFPAVPEEVFVALAGALHELVATEVRQGRTVELPRLEETTVRLHLALLANWPAD